MMIIIFMVVIYLIRKSLCLCTSMLVHIIKRTLNLSFNIYMAGILITVCIWWHLYTTLSKPHTLRIHPKSGISGMKNTFKSFW